MGSGYPLARFRHLRPTVGGSGYSPAAAGDSGAQPEQVRFRPGPQTAPPLPVPGSGGSSGPIGVPVGASTILGQWIFDDPGFDDLAYKDLAYRWLHHDPTLEAPGGHATIEPGAGVGTTFDGSPSGVAATHPYISLGYHPDQYGSGNTIIDWRTTPIWTLVIYWDNPGHPSFHSGDPVAPSPGTTTPVPIFGRIYTNSFIVGYQWSYGWSGVPFNWNASGFVLQPFVSVGGSGGTSVVVPVAGPPVTIIEFDHPNSKVTPNIGPSGGVTIPWVWGGNFWPDSDQVFCGGNMGPYYSSNYQHPAATIQACLIHGDTLVNTVKLINNKTLAPAHGPKTLNAVRFRSAPNPQAPTGSRLSEYSHYWPLADASPGPMVDVIAGAKLTVQNRSLATFQYHAEDDADADAAGGDSDADDAPGIRLTAASLSTSAYLARDLSAPAAIGAGGVGADFTIALWLNWEGQQPFSMGPMFSLLRSTTVPFGFVSEAAVDIYIGLGQAEPFGVSFDTWASGPHHFDACSTAGFDWPSGVDPSEVAAHGFAVTKLPTWALAAFVYRTDTLAHTVQKEIWIDGVMVKSAAADAGGWGASVDIATVGGLGQFSSDTVGTFRQLAFFPFALSVDDLAYAPLA